MIWNASENRGDKQPNPSANSAKPMDAQNAFEAAKVTGVDAAHYQIPRILEEMKEDEAAARSREMMACHKPRGSDPVKKRVENAVRPFIDIPPSRMDPNGSYTGRPTEYGAVPVQDADDL